MKAGRELDMLVAEKVMGLITLPYTQGVKQIGDYSGPVYEIDRRWKPLPYYSSDIAAAWEVVERLRENWRIDITMENKIAAILYSRHGNIRMSEHIGNADTAPLAICLVALKARGVEV